MTYTPNAQQSRKRSQMTISWIECGVQASTPPEMTRKEQTQKTPAVLCLSAFMICASNFARFVKNVCRIAPRNRLPFPHSDG
jgi:hypothetical protein